jgi:hypothetical protein
VVDEESAEREFENMARTTERLAAPRGTEHEQLASGLAVIRRTSRARRSKLPPSNRTDEHALELRRRAARELPTRSWRAVERPGAHAGRKTDVERIDRHLKPTPSAGRPGCSSKPRARDRRSRDAGTANAARRSAIAIADGAKRRRPAPRRAPVLANEPALVGTN